MKLSIIADAIRGQRLRFTGIVLGVAMVALALVFERAEPLHYVVILTCGTPIIWGALVGVIQDRDITADVLVSIAIVAAVLIGEGEAAAEIAVIMQIGAFLEEATVGRATAQIDRLGGLAPKTARVLGPEGERDVPVGDVAVGDVARVAPGETIPVDGVVVSGHTSVDMSALTGESVPVDVAPGDRVSSGTSNLYGSIDVEVDRPWEDSTISRMTHMLELASANKPRIVRTADKWAVYIVVIALAVAIATLLLTRDVYRAVTVLVVFCPCALILATPTAIMAAAGCLSKRGILIRNGNAMEGMASVDTVIMDKTGTLTTGMMRCMGFESTCGIDTGYLATLASSLEARSEHPLGRAVAGYGPADLPVEGFEYVPGMGVSGIVDGRDVVAGNRRFMAERCPEGLEAAVHRGGLAESDGYTVIYIGVDGRTAGISLISDTLRSGSRTAIDSLRGLGITTIMLTGDTAPVARRVSSSLELDDVVWECLPEDKLRTVEAVERAHRVCMVGDGVNDAPSLRAAEVGISMGGMGSDLARNSSDIVFMDDDISKLGGVVRMGRRTLLTIRTGIAFSLILNTAAMALAVLGMIGPVAGALVHNIGSVIVIVAAAMLMRYDCWDLPSEAESGHHAEVGSAA